MIYLKTNNFPTLHLSPASSVDNNYTIENPANLDSEAQINSRVRRTVPSLREICLSKLHPGKIPQFGDACFANFLNNVNKYNQRNQPIGITQTEINQLASEWISSITGNQMELLHATFFNALSRAQIRALTPEQLVRIRPAEFQRLSSTFFNNLNTDQIQVITRDQIHNISIASWEEISREQLEIFRCEQISWIHPDLFKEFDMEFFDNLIFGSQDPLNAIILPITGITREQMRNIPSSFFNSASDQLIQAFTPEQISWIHPNIFKELNSDNFFKSLNFYQLRWLSSEQIAALPDFIFVPKNAWLLLGRIYVNLATFTPSQLPHLNPEIFRILQKFQISELSEMQIRSLTNEQIRKIPPEVFEAMSEKVLARIYRSFTEEQRSNLTPEQRAIFRRIMGEVTGAADTSNSDRRPPPSGGGSGGEGRGPGSSGGTSGGTRPKDWNLVAKQYGVSSEFSNKKEHAPFLPLEYIRKAPPEFWNEYAGPKKEIRTASYTAQGLPIVEVILTDLAEYQGWIRELKCDQIQSIPPAVISKLDWFVLEAFSAKQIFWMTLEQRKACTTGFIKIEPELRELLGISKHQTLTLNGKQISSSQSLVPEDYETLMDQLDGKQLQQRFSPEKIRNLAKNPRSFLLPFLKPEHIISVDSHDLLPSQIEALGKEIITEIWSSTYFNKLVPDQRKGILPYIAEIDPKVIANWKAQCFDSPGENPVIHENYRDQIRKFTQKQIASIAPEVIAILGVRFFRDYLSPQQVRMLRKEQLQAISASTLSKLPADWFYHLMEEKEGGTWDTQRVSFLRENQVKAIPLTFFSKFGEKVGKRVALQFLEGIWRSQVQAISKEQLNALSAADFSLLSADFLNKLNTSQINTRTPAQIAALGVFLLPAIRNDFIVSLTADQIKGWSPQQVSALRENQIRALGGKISTLHPQVYRDVKAVNHLLLYGSIQQLKLLSKEQVQKVDLSKISVKDFGQASAQKGTPFVNFFKEPLIARQNSEYRKIISNRVYAQLIREIHNGLTDEECKQLVVNMTVAQYRIGLKSFIDTLETASEGMLTDGERRAILLGTYRLRMAKGYSTETIVPVLNRNAEPYSVETQVPIPPAERRIPDDQASNAQLPVPQSDNRLALSGAHTRTDL